MKTTCVSKTENGRARVQYPSQLKLAHYLNPALTGEWWADPHESTFAVSDVYFAEVAILAQICENTDTLFTVARGEPWRCEVSAERYRSLADALTASEKQRMGGNGR